MEERPTPDPRANVEYMRGLLGERVERYSLRRVAREVGMSPTGLKKFLLGTDPYGPTVRRLRKWYLNFGADLTGVLQKEEARIALDVLTSDIAPALRGEAAGALLESLNGSYERSRKEPPRWFGELRAEYDAKDSAGEPPRGYSVTPNERRDAAPRPLGGGFAAPSATQLGAPRPMQRAS
jgi:transcriptional regulator with XRE-family HTH domain